MEDPPADVPAALDVLYLLYPMHGHVAPNLATLAELCRRGHRVRVVTGDGFAGPVGRTGVDLTPLDPPLPPPPDFTGMTNERWGEESFAPFLGLVAATRGVLDDAAARGADVVVFDSAMWAPARLVASRLGIPAVEVCPTLFAHRPFTTGTMRAEAPDPDGERERLAAFGGQLVTLMAEHGIPDLSPADFAPRPGEPAVVHVPAVFAGTDAVTRDEHGPVHHVGRTFAPPAGDWRPPAGAGPVLLLSLGTSSNDQPALLAGCVAAFAGSRWHVVLTLGAGVAEAALGPLPGNVEVHRWLAHGEVLPYAGAAVSHGGMGSVLEALAAGVPVVAIPTHPEATANGRRVAEAGLGRCIPHADISGPAIRAAVDAVAAELATDPRAAERLDRARAAAGSGGGASAAADVVERAAAARSVAV